MKKYIILFIFFCFALILIDDCYASTTGWAYDKLHPISAFPTDCGTYSCTTDLSPQGQNVNNSTTFYYQGRYNTMVGNGNGMMWSYLLDTPLKSGFLYSISTYICHQSSNYFVFKRVASSESLSNTQNLSHSGNIYYNQILANFPTAPFDSSSIYTQCGVISLIYQPSYNSKYFGVNYTLNATTNNYTSALVGYEIESLGDATNLTTSDIQNVINNSGLATASSIQQVQSEQQEIKREIQELNNSIDAQTQQQAQQHQETIATITDDSTTGANSQANSFFSNFTSSNFGLSSIITMPLNFINGLASSTCYNLDLPMPFVNQHATLPCMLPIYQQYFGSFLTLYQTITTGIIGYWVCVNIFRSVRGFKNPESDQVEVMDL